MSFDEYAQWRDSQAGVPPQPNRRRYLKKIKTAWDKIYVFKLKINTSQSVKNEIEKFLKENHMLNPRIKLYSDNGQRRWYVNTDEIATAFKVKFGEHVERNDNYEGYGEYLAECAELQGIDFSLQQGTLGQSRYSNVDYQD